MSHLGSSWMRLDRATAEWQQRMTNYLVAPLEAAVKEERHHVHVQHVVPCHIENGRRFRSICFGKVLMKVSFESKKVYVKVQLLMLMMMVIQVIKSLIRGAIHGEINEEQPNEKAKKVYQLLEEAKKELFPGCTEATKVSFIVKMFQLKCMFGCSNACLEFLLHLFWLILPPGHCLPDSMEKIRKVVRDLGLNYEKIDACYNDCVLFRGSAYEDLDNCPKCGESRWKKSKNAEAVGSSSGSKKRPPRKMLRFQRGDVRHLRLWGEKLWLQDWCQMPETRHYVTTILG